MRYWLFIMNNFYASAWCRMHSVFGLSVRLGVRDHILKDCNMITHKPLTVYVIVFYQRWIHVTPVFTFTEHTSSFVFQTHFRANSILRCFVSRDRSRPTIWNLKKIRWLNRNFGWYPD